MISINMDSIIKKADAFIHSSSGKKSIDSAIDKYVYGANQGYGSHTPQEAADKFISILHESIDSSSLSEHGKETVGMGINSGSPEKISMGTYVITIHFGDTYRPSLQEDRYGGVDIVKLLNSGVGKTMRPVSGMWHGEKIWSRTKIPATNFIENAISTFMSSYASEYNVKNIEYL